MDNFMQKRPVKDEAAERKKRIAARKAKKRRKRLIIMLSILVFFIGIAAVSPFGADIIEHHVKDNKDGDPKFNVDLQEWAANTYLTWGEYLKAAKAYGVLHREFTEHLEDDKLLQFRKQELACYFESKQFLTCEEILEEFWENYDIDDRRNDVKKVEMIQFNIDTMSLSKKVNHAWY